MSDNKSYIKPILFALGFCIIYYIVVVLHYYLNVIIKLHMLNHFEIELNNDPNSKPKPLKKYGISKKYEYETSKNRQRRGRQITYLEIYHRKLYNDYKHKIENVTDDDEKKKEIAKKLINNHKKRLKNKMSLLWILGGPITVLIGFIGPPKND